MLDRLTTPVYNRMKVWGDTLLTAEVDAKLHMISVAIVLSAFLSFLSYSYEGAKIARTFVESFPVRLLLGILIAGLPMATLTVLIDTYLVSTSKRRGQSSWKALVARGLLIFANSYFVSKGLVDLVTAVDRAHIIARDEAKKINDIRVTATAEARTTATADIAALRGRTNEGVQQDLQSCQEVRDDKQREIREANAQLEDERRNNRGVGRNWRGIDVRLVRLNSELGVIQARCTNISTQARLGTEAAINERNAQLRAELARIAAMTPPQLAASYPALWQQSRGFIRDEQALRTLREEVKWLPGFLAGLQLFFLMIEFYPAFKKVFSGVVFEQYFTVEDQAAAGNAWAIQLLMVEGHTNLQLATMIPAVRAQYDDHESALQMFEKALIVHIDFLVRLARHTDERGFHLRLEDIQGQLHANWTTNVEPHRVTTQRLRDKNATAQPPVASIFTLLGGASPWKFDFTAWKVSEEYLERHGWINPITRREELKPVLEALGKLRDQLTRLLAHHRALLLRRVTLTLASEKLDMGVILRERADAWIDEVRPILDDLALLEAELGKAAPPWDSDPRPGLEGRFCTPWMEIRQICLSTNQAFELPPGLVMAGPNDPNQPHTCPQCHEANLGFAHCSNCGYKYWIPASAAPATSGVVPPVPFRQIMSVAVPPPSPAPRPPASTTNGSKGAKGRTVYNIFDPADPDEKTNPWVKPVAAPPPPPAPTRPITLSGPPRPVT